MKREMSAKYAGRCRCGNSFGKGATIIYDRSMRAVVGCHGCTGFSDSAPTGIVGPCWACGNSEGRFRSYGAATPVYCDGCERAARDRRRNPTNYTPDPVDIAYEDQCAAACGLDGFNRQN